MATGLLSAVKGLGIRTTRFPHPPDSNPFERERTGVYVYAGIVCVGKPRISAPSAILDRNPIGCLGVITPTAMNSGTAQVFQLSGTGSVAPDENPVKDKPCGWLHTSPSGSESWNSSAYNRYCLSIVRELLSLIL